jgi:hypothetical protein
MRIIKRNYYNVSKGNIYIIQHKKIVCIVLEIAKYYART